MARRFPTKIESIYIADEKTEISTSMDPTTGYIHGGQSRKLVLLFTGGTLA
jgi:hypothetical protein